MKNNISTRRWAARMGGFLTGVGGSLLLTEAMARGFLQGFAGYPTFAFALPRIMATMVANTATLPLTAPENGDLLNGNRALLYLLLLSVAAIAFIVTVLTAVTGAGYVGAKRSVAFLEKRGTLPTWAYGGWVLFAGALMLSLMHR